MTTRALTVLKTQHMGPYLDWALKLYLLLKCNLWWHYFLLPRAILPEMQLVQVWSFGHYYRHLYFIFVLFTSLHLDYFTLLPRYHLQFFWKSNWSFCSPVAAEVAVKRMMWSKQDKCKRKINLNFKFRQKVEFAMHFVSFVRNWAKSGH